MQHPAVRQMKEMARAYERRYWGASFCRKPYVPMIPPRLPRDTCHALPIARRWWPPRFMVFQQTSTELVSTSFQVWCQSRTRHQTGHSRNSQEQSSIACMHAVKNAEQNTVAHKRHHTAEQRHHISILDLVRSVRDNQG